MKQIWKGREDRGQAYCYLPRQGECPGTEVKRTETEQTPPIHQKPLDIQNFHVCPEVLQQAAQNETKHPSSKTQL